MASTKHYNNIKIARGTRAKWLADANPSYGELFYDKTTQGVYIYVYKKDADGNDTTELELKRFGGFDSMVIKGTITADNFADVKAKAEPGDAYIVTGSINVVMNEVTFTQTRDELGNIVSTVTRNSDSKRTYDNFFKNGQVIIFTDKDVSAIPNAYAFNDAEITANEEGSKGIITLAGTAEAVDLEYDGSHTEVADGTVEGGATITDVQTALDTLFNEKMEYVGAFKTVDVSSTTLTDDDAQAATSDDAVWALIAKQQKLLMGQSMVYSGETKAIKVNGREDKVTIRTNTMIVNNAGIIYTIPLGASDARDIAIEFSGNIKSDESVGITTTKNADGTDATLASSLEAKTVQHALDYLHQNKADLNANGKIPLSQIPSTMIGALQYVGTTTIPETTTTLKASELAVLMNSSKTGSWEKDTDTESSSAKVNAYNNLDEGDYVIISVTIPEKDGKENKLSRQITITAEDGTTELFKISNGDHVIVNSKAEDGTFVFDHINSSAAVDSVNEILGSVEIIDNKRTVVTGFANDGTATTEEILETDVQTNKGEHSIKTDISNAVLEATEIPAHNIPQAGGSGKSIVQSDLSINDIKHNSKYKTGNDKTHNTELVGKKANGDEVVVEFPDASGKLSVTTGKGTEDVLPKYDAHGNLIDSEVKQTKDATTGKGTVHLGDNFDINYDELAKLFTYLKGTDTVTRLFDHDSATINSESWTNRTHDENTLVVLDEDSAIDGGEWN